MKRIFDKIEDNINDSEIIQDIEREKCNDPKFDINSGCDGNNWTLLMDTVEHGREELVRYLLSVPSIDVNTTSIYYYTALHFCRQLSILKLLLNRKDLDVNIQNYYGQTGLHILCTFRYKTLVRELLLDARIDVLLDVGGKRPKIKH